jgi:hypothetical protein
MTDYVAIRAINHGADSGERFVFAPGDDVDTSTMSEEQVAAIRATGAMVPREVFDALDQAEKAAQKAKDEQASAEAEVTRLQTLPNAEEYAPNAVSVANMRKLAEQHNAEIRHDDPPEQYGESGVAMVPPPDNAPHFTGSTPDYGASTSSVTARQDLERVNADVRVARKNQEKPEEGGSDVSPTPEEPRAAKRVLGKNQTNKPAE